MAELAGLGQSDGSILVTRAMRLLLQQTKTGLYFQRPDIWTRNLRVATDFGTSQRAIEYATSNRMRDVRPVAAFFEGSYIDSVAFSAVSTPTEASRITAGL